MLAERYRLILTHDLIDDKNVIKLEEPKLCEVHNIDLSDSYVSSNKNQIINRLMNMMLDEINKEEGC